MEKNSSRRKFLKHFGVAVGATSLIGADAFAAAERKSNFEKQINFLSKYEVWVDQYVEVIESEKKNCNNIVNKHRIMELAAQAENWQEDIALCLHHEEFRERYIKLSKRLANAITPDLEA
ncbi:MAG: hypothetical protein ACEPOZ_08855 [Marinifilaceae bacterium]